MSCNTWVCNCQLVFCKHNTDEGNKPSFSWKFSLIYASHYLKFRESGKLFDETFENNPIKTVLSWIVLEQTGSIFEFLMFLVGNLKKQNFPIEWKKILFGHMYVPTEVVFIGKM